MRPVTLNHNNPSEALREIERASHENDLNEISQNITFDGAFTQQLQLLVTAPTLDNTNKVLATLIDMFQKGGLSRTT